MKHLHYLRYLAMLPALNSCERPKDVPPADIRPSFDGISCNLSVEQTDGGYEFRLKFKTDSIEPLYIIEPDAEMGFVWFFSQSNGIEDYGAFPSISSEGGFAGWRSDPSLEYEVRLHAKFNTNGEFVIQESGQLLAPAGNSLDVAANVTIRASAFRSGVCRSFHLKTNPVIINVPPFYRKSDGGISKEKSDSQLIMPDLPPP